MNTNQPHKAWHPEGRNVVAPNGNRAICTTSAMAHRIVRAMNAHDRLTNALAEAVKVEKEDLKAMGVCDHPVNMCVCGLVSQIEDHVALLKELGVDVPK